MGLWAEIYGVASSVTMPWSAAKEAESKLIQDRREVSLVLIIDRAASETTSKSLGNRFLRVVKRSSPDQTPTKKEIGTRDFDYLIDGSRSDGSMIAKRERASDSSEIIWWRASG